MNQSKEKIEREKKAYIRDSIAFYLLVISVLSFIGIVIYIYMVNSSKAKNAFNEGKTIVCRNGDVYIEVNKENSILDGRIFIRKNNDTYYRFNTFDCSLQLKKFKGEEEL